MDVPERHDTTYRPLSSPRSIRLASLGETCSASPGKLTIHLKPVNLDNLPPWSSYTALSYVWGQNPTLVEVNCTAGSLQITQSLYDALKAIWDATPSELVWADALCINQSDNSERSSQVQIMGAIYRRASSTIIWLGHPSSDPDIATGHSHRSQIKKVQHLVHGLLSSGWLQRMWTLQEIVLTSKAVVMYGGQWMGWRELANTILSDRLEGDNDNVLHSSIRFIELYRLQMATLPTLANQTNKIFGSQSIDLTDIILATRTRSCSDRHDKIYALLAILYSKSYYFSVSYDQPNWTTFAQATAKSIMLDHKVSLLSCAGLIQATSTGQGWPSWVPDLMSTKLLDDAFRLTSQASTRIIAWPHLAKDSYFDFEMQNPNVMKMRAWAIGIILREHSSIADHPAYMDPGSSSSACDELVEIPSCAQLDYRFTLVPTSSTTTVGVYSLRKGKAILAKDVVTILEAHRKHQCTCSTSLRESKLLSTRPKSAYHPSMRTICLLDDKFRSEVRSWDWVCEIPLRGGLCILRPTPSAQFQLVGTSAAFPSLANQLKPQLKSLLEELKETSDDIPTALMTFELL